MIESSDVRLKPGILFVLGWRPVSRVGGVANVILHFLDQIRIHGQYKSYLVALAPPDDGPATPDLDAAPYHMRMRDPLWPGNRVRVLLAFLLGLPAVWWRLRAIVRKHSIRIVVCEFPGNTYLAITLMRRLGLFSGTVLFRLHGADIELALRSRGLDRLLYRFTYRTADWILPCSSGLRDDVVRLDPQLAKRTVVIRHGADADEFLAEAARHELPAPLRGRKFLLNIGRFEHKKAQDVTIAAFERIADRFPDLLLVLIGASGTGTETVMQRVAASPVASRIFMYQELPNESMPAYLTAAQLFVLPSRREGFPIVLMEAGACRVPVVAAAAIGIVDVIRDGDTGRLVPVEDSEALANAIAELLDDPESRARLAGNLHRLVTENYTWQKAYEKFIQVATSRRA